MEAAVGSRVLAQIEETSLEEVLNGMRSMLENDSADDKPNRIGRATLTHLDELDQIAARHFRATQAPMLSISGRSLPLLYKVVSNLVSPPHQMAVLVIDLETRFDVTRLSCTDADIRHVYVQRPARITSSSSEEDTEINSSEQLRALIAEGHEFMFYGVAARPSGSGTRPFWGTIVIGAPGAGDISAAWKGWLRVDREHVREYALGISAEEALQQRAQRQQPAEAAGWAATSPWGSFVFREGE